MILRFNYVLLLMVCCIQASGQVYTVENGDATYQNYISDATDTLGYWALKDSLPQGEYWVVQKTECKTDTLKHAWYTVGGKRHGEWTEWLPSFCEALIDEDTGETLEWNAAPAEMHDKLLYDSGFLVSRSWFFYESGKARVKFYYPENTTDKSHWNREDIISEEGLPISIFKEDRFGNTTFNGFYESGELKFKEDSDLVGNSLKPSIFYFKSGEVKAKGKLKATERSSRFNRVTVRDGVWRFWNEQQELIAKVWYNVGVMEHAKVFKTSNLSIEEILKGL